MAKNQRFPSRGKKKEKGGPEKNTHIHHSRIFSGAYQGAGEQSKNSSDNEGAHALHRVRVVNARLRIIHMVRLQIDTLVHKGGGLLLIPPLSVSVEGVGTTTHQSDLSGTHSALFLAS
jgi:hypothetical protein